MHKNLEIKKLICDRAGGGIWGSCGEAPGETKAREREKPCPIPHFLLVRSQD